MIRILPATSPAELDQVRRLVQAFVGWLKNLYPENSTAVDAYFESLKPELAGLPGEYAPPAGRLLLASVDGQIAGTVALRDLGGGRCEMKRMFVDTAYHGQRVGYALANALISEARSAGY